jgi:hypothetical protein
VLVRARSNFGSNSGRPTEKTSTLVLPQSAPIISSVGADTLQPSTYNFYLLVNEFGISVAVGYDADTLRHNHEMFGMFFGLLRLHKSPKARFQPTQLEIEHISGGLLQFLVVFAQFVIQCAHWASISR